MGDVMSFPDTFEEFAEQYKIVDKQQIYTNGTEMIPIFRVKQWLYERPTADVVPKSEVEKEIKNWQELYADTVSKWEKAYEELEIKLENTKAEVAREIFEEIEEGIKAAFAALQFERNPVHRKVKNETYSSLMRFVMTVKKKYTEEQNDA